MVLYFRFDRAIVDKGYMGNSETLRHLDEVLSDSALTHRIDSIRILSFSSPEGDRSYNERLTRKRSVAVVPASRSTPHPSPPTGRKLAGTPAYDSG